jgi:hypothetical protein
MPLIRLPCLALLLLVFANVGAGAQQNQQQECFMVFMTNATGGGSLGSILLNKCTGDSWILIRTSLPNGLTTSRWYPISVEKSEFSSITR